MQAGVLQDKEISTIFPGSVNTIRIITENLRGESRIVCAMLRMGRGQSGIDNASPGGIFIGIDIENGKVRDHARSKLNEKFSRHPDTGFEFRNFTISRWDEIQRFTIESADKIPLFAHLGWDIALTHEGPIAIETNINMGIESLQIANGGLREKFGITNPDYYWKNPGKRI